MRCDKRLPANEKAKKVITFGRSNENISVIFKHKKFYGSEVLILGNCKVKPTMKRLNSIVTIETFSEVLIMASDEIESTPHSAVLDDI